MASGDRRPVEPLIHNLGLTTFAVAPGRSIHTHSDREPKRHQCFALPGGPLARQPGQHSSRDKGSALAGVMAHEMGHVIMRHSDSHGQPAMPLAPGTRRAGAFESGRAQGLS